MSADSDQPVQPVSGKVVPRFAGPSTFARLPELRDVAHCDVAVLGVPFDAGTSYRPGARFGPQAIRQASRHLRTQYHPAYDAEPFVQQQVADAGDVACNPYNIATAIEQIQTSSNRITADIDRFDSRALLVGARIDISGLRDSRDLPARLKGVLRSAGAETRNISSGPDLADSFASGTIYRCGGNDDIAQAVQSWVRSIVELPIDPGPVRACGNVDVRIVFIR